MKNTIHGHSKAIHLFRINKSLSASEATKVKSSAQMLPMLTYCLAFSQLRICRLHLVSFDPVFMNDAERAEMNEKSILRFLFFELS